MSGDSPSPELLEWAEKAVSSRVKAVTREFAGGSRPLWYLSFDDAEECVLRLDTGVGALSGSIYSIQREVDVYRALEATDVPVPRIIAAKPVNNGFVILMNRISGTSRFPRNDDIQLHSMIGALVCAIATLHELNASGLGLPWRGAATIREAVEAEIAQWSSLAEPLRDPVCDFALNWLQDRLSGLTGIDEPASLVQGDTGPGNAVFDSGELTALVDWELSHFGDPMEDIAWIKYRCRQFGGDLANGSAVRCIYETTLNRRCDEARIAFQAVFVYLKCAVITARTIAQGGGALGLNPYHLARQRFRSDIIEAIALADDVAIESSESTRKRIAEEIGFSDTFLADEMAKLPAASPDTSAEKLAIRDRNLGLLHDSCVAAFEDKLRGIRDQESVPGLERLAVLVACESLLWPDTTVVGVQ